MTEKQLNNQLHLKKRLTLICVFTHRDVIKQTCWLNRRLRTRYGFPTLIVKSAQHIGTSFFGGKPLGLYHWGSPLLLFPRPSHKLSLMPLTSLCYVPTTPVISKLSSMMLNTSPNPWPSLLPTSYFDNRWTKYFTDRKCNEMSDPIVLVNYSEFFCLLWIYG